MHVDQEIPITKLNFSEILRGDRRDRAIRALIVAAHPDDEVAGAGGRFRFLSDLQVVHITDGAPRNMMDAAARGFDTREAYARARRRELLKALELASIKPRQCVELGVADQEASYHMHYLVYTLSNILRRARPDLVLAPAYEGGHPDHDAAAFAVHTACEFLEKSGIAPPPLVEYALYHGFAGGATFSDFIPQPGIEVFDCRLSTKEQGLKQKMLSYFETQKNVLTAFDPGVERFRPAPKYDFTLPPHFGLLYYERFNWGITGERWRTITSDVLNVLEIGGAI